ncbi:MAG TPA: 2-oxo-4-hydroxy-4-carboxy-5-ureidoimidazoline decarboxylase [Thermoanaerobaculia bacterium]|nr:2-oxo-4-hydroxy-4-carboxy-5-ureidoimidazoline decarboxylase [Thermoanaerobaculia bacterium]
MSAARGALRSRLARCCAARRWVDEMVEQAPWRDLDALLGAGDDAFDALERSDWLEAFAAHPRIGDLDALRRRFDTEAGDPRALELAASEQAAAAGAAEATLRALANGNARYRERFGYIFIVFASGKGAEEMLRLLDQRLGNDPDRELRIAASEQRKITHKRLAEAAAEILAAGAEAGGDVPSSPEEVP